MGILDRFLKKKEKSRFDLDIDEPLGNASDNPLSKPSYKPMSGRDMGLPELDSTTNEDFDSEASPLRSYQPKTYPGKNVGANARGNQNHLSSARDVELILSKLDTIKSILTNLDIRVSNLEKVAGVQRKTRNRYQW